MRAAAALSACTRTENHPGQCTAHALLHSAESLDTQRGEEGCIKRAGLVCRAHRYNVAAHRHGRTTTFEDYMRRCPYSDVVTIWTPGLGSESRYCSECPGGRLRRKGRIQAPGPRLHFRNGEILTRIDSPRYPHPWYPPIGLDVCRCTSYGNPTVHKN